MQDQDYVQAALRTEAPLTPELVARLQLPSTLMDFSEALGEAINAAADIDHFKKYFFYGRQLPNFNPPNTFGHAIGMSQHIADLRVIRLLHAAMGLFTEAGEILEALEAYIYNGKPLDLINIFEEGGDEFWYMAILSDALGRSFEEMKERNIAKLAARYPEKFTEEKAQTRDLSKERQVLQSCADGACGCCDYCLSR